MLSPRARFQIPTLAAALLAALAGCTGTVSGGPFGEPDGAAPAPDASDAPSAPDAAAPDAAPINEQGPLPVLLIDTGGQEIPDGDKIAATMRVVEDHDGSLADPADLAARPATFDGAIGIEIRGNTSTMFPKHSFGLETRDGAGADLDVPLAGLPADSDWVLYAPYTDKTLMRDRLAYDVGAALGRYQPRSRYVELFVDGSYEGVYLLLEKIKRGHDRVDIPKVAASAATGDITGGYIFKSEGGGDGVNTPWEPHYPKAADINEEQSTYLYDFIGRFEAAMRGEDLGGRASYADWIDEASFIDFVIVTELSRNVDGYRKSAYLYKTRDADGGRVFAGPLWDFNIAFGNADYCGGYDTTGFQFSRDACEDELEIPDWWPRLVTEPAFADALRCRWESLRTGLLSDEALEAQLSGYRTILATAEQRDHGRWPVLGEWVWPNPYVGQTWDEELAYLQEWIAGRTAWLDDNLPGTCQ